MTQVTRIVVIHNRYQQAGGEDNVVCAEVALLRSKGHEVKMLEETNDDIVGLVNTAKVAGECVYSLSSARRMRKIIDRFAPDLVHIHNFFPRISPSVHYVCRQARVPIVQTLHNYRLLCPASTFLRDREICEDCIGKTIPWPSVQHGCYRKSRMASAAVANMISVHRALKTWSRTVSRFIAPTEFARGKFIEGGFPAERTAVKPNFVHPDPGMGRGTGGYALFVGRLSEEKGIETLLSAWSQLRPREGLKIVGDGPLAASVADVAATVRGIEWLGPRTRSEVSLLMADAAFLVVPSACYETFGLVLVEAMAAGLPVIASRLGAIAELVLDGHTGRLFTAGRSNELAALIIWALSHSGELRTMRYRARQEFERRYTADSSYKIVADIYKAAQDSIVISADAHTLS